jgi:hypothetical protein
MKSKVYSLAAVLVICLNFIPALTSQAQAQTNEITEYGSLNDIVPLIAAIKRDILFRPRPAIAPGASAPNVLNPTGPIGITTAPSAPGKYPLVRWLLPGGPPPAQTSILAPLTCNYDDC